MKKFHQTIPTIRSVLFTLLLGCFMLEYSAVQAQITPTVTTDKFSYSLHETVTISGTGFQSGELVNLITTNFYDGTPILEQKVSLCNQDGSFSTSFIMSNPYYTYRLAATGQSTGRTAEVLFNQLPRVNIFTSGLPDIELVNLRLTYTDRHNKIIDYPTYFTGIQPLSVLPCYPGTTFSYYNISTCYLEIPYDICFDFIGGSPASGFTVIDREITDLTLNFCEYPQITSGPTLITAAAPAESCSAIVNFTGENAVTATGHDDIYGPITISYNPASGTAFPVGITQVTATAKNQCGGESFYHFNVKVTDPEPPSFSSNFPASRTVVALTGNCYKAVSWIEPSATDNCPGTPAIQQIAGLQNGSDFPVGISTVTYRATDVSGNSTEKSFTITVIDREPPKAPDDVEITVECPQQTGPLSLVAIDNCDGEITGVFVEAQLDPNPIVCEGTIIGKYSFTDKSGNISYTNFKYIIDRTVPPREFGGPVSTNGGTIECIADAKQPGINDFPVVKDACGNFIRNWKSMRIEGTYSYNCPGREGTYIYVYTYEDCTGLTFDWKYTYNVVRTTPPHIVVIPGLDPLPTSKTISCPSEAITPTTPMVEDVCGIPLLFKLPILISGTYKGCEGTFIYNYTWEDCAGKKLEWSFTYIIDRDDLTIPNNITTNVDCIEEVVDPTPPLAVIDGCGNTISPTGPAIQENIVDGKGTKSYSWIYTDCTGKEYPWTYQYVIEDKIPPEVNCPTEPVLVDNNPGTCYTEFDITDLNNFPKGELTLSDNCGTAILSKIESDWSYEFENIRQLTVGNHIIKILVTDAAGNETTCEYPLNIVDNDPPLITCPSDAVLGTNMGCRYLGSIGTATATDMCTRESLIKITNNAPLAFEIGTTPVLWTAEDAAGNTASCTQLISVNDDDVPEISCPPDVTDVADEGECGAVVNYEASATDNCSVDVTYNPTSGSFFPVGTTQVTATATDPAGSKKECTFNVTITNTAPVIQSVTPDLAVVPINTPVSFSIECNDIENNISEIAINWGDGTNTTVNTPSHIYSLTGVFAVTLTVTDACGLSDTKDYEFIVVYDPSAGFVTGGGWIDSPKGALISDPELTDRANFGFVAKYLKGKSYPDGNTEFQFKAGNLNFKSTDYDWLVIADSKAQFKGNGTINGLGNFGFMLSAIDAELTPSVTTDCFRIKIWDKDDGDNVIYDNQLSVADNADPTTTIGGGSIVIHSNENKIKSAQAIDPEHVGSSFKVWPIPFTERLFFEFSNSYATHAKLEIFDIAGSKLETLFDMPISSCIVYSVEYLPKMVSSHILFYRYTVGNDLRVGKLIFQEKR